MADGIIDTTTYYRIDGARIGTVGEIKTDKMTRGIWQNTAGTMRHGLSQIAAGNFFDNGGYSNCSPSAPGWGLYCVQQ